MVATGTGLNSTAHSIYEVVCRSDPDAGMNILPIMSGAASGAQHSRSGA